MDALEEVRPRIAARERDPHAAHGNSHQRPDLQEPETDGGGSSRGQFDGR
jgi:hypothetical protein